MRINLLPAYVIEQEKVRKFAALAGILVALVILVMLLMHRHYSAKYSDLQIKLAEAEAGQRRVEQLRADAQRAKQETQLKLSKVQYIEAVLQYNEKVPALYEQLAKYTYKNIVYRSVTPSNTQITIEAYARNIGDAGRYLLNMYKATDLFSSVSISAVPGYPQAVTTVVGGVRQAPSAPTVQLPAALPYAAITGPLARALAAPETVYSQALPGLRPPQPKALKIRQVPAGFNFSVTCTLTPKWQINPPVWGGTAGAAAGGAPGMPGAPGAPGGPGYPQPGVPPPSGPPAGEGGEEGAAAQRSGPGM